MSKHETGLSAEERRRARETAYSMFEGRGFNRDDIARTIGAESRYDRVVCYYFLQLFDFEGMDVVAAIRLFLSKFPLNAEAQEIDRIMYSFAERFCEQNRPEYSADAVHALSMAILLLNTDLHTPDNPRRMREDQFINNLAALNDGADFPRPFLQRVFRSISAEELTPVATASQQQAAQHGNSSQHGNERPYTVQRGRPTDILDVFFHGESLETPALEGTLKQKDTFDAFRRRTSFRHRSWRSLHAAVLGRYLIFHKPQFEPRLLHDYSQNIYDAVVLYHAFCRRALDYTKRDHVFELTTANGRRMLLLAPTSDDMDKWISRINTIAATSSAPPLPAPAASGGSSSFTRPMLPLTKTSETLEEQVARYKAQLRQLRDQLTIHKGERDQAQGQSRKRLQAWAIKREYLEFELERIATYYDILNGMHQSSDALTRRRLKSSHDDTTISASSPRRLRDRFLVMPRYSEPQISWV